MELEIGMSRISLRKLADEIIANCDSSKRIIEVTRLIDSNDREGKPLTLTFNNIDIVDDETMMYWDMSND